MPRPVRKARPRSHRREGSRMVNIWVTEEERELMLTRAAADGRTLGPWMRWVCLREARNPA